MPLTPSQSATFATDFRVTHAAEFADEVAARDDQLIANAYNAVQTPDYWVWKTRLTHEDCVGDVSADGTTWSWTALINRSQGERDVWRQMFATSAQSINPAKANIRQGIADIFSGGTGAAQRTHLLAMARRKATRVERLFATGEGTTTTPGTLAFEGQVTYLDVAEALRGA